MRTDYTFSGFPRTSKCCSCKFQRVKHGYVVLPDKRFHRRINPRDGNHCLAVLTHGSCCSSAMLAPHVNRHKRGKASSQEKQDEAA